MTACIFHDTTTAATQERRLFEIVERAYNEHEKVLIYVQDENRAAAIDKVLWILKQEAFIPHQICRENESVEVPIAIVTGEMKPLEAGILIADGHCSLDFACGFDKVHEFVNRSTPSLHQACRDRFREYRNRQVSVEYSK
jgi:DNA polymerase IIIc chi subunit